MVNKFSAGKFTAGKLKRYIDWEERKGLGLVAVFEVESGKEEISFFEGDLGTDLEEICTLEELSEFIASDHNLLSSEKDIVNQAFGAHFGATQRLD